VLLPGDLADRLLDGEGTDLSPWLAALQPDMALLELGDPGAVHGDDFSIDDLPALSGPPGPIGGPPPEWGAAAAETEEPEEPATNE
jgi:hypothetical protein